MCIAACRQHLENTIPNLKDADIKGTATQIKDKDCGFVLFVQPVCQRRGRRFVDNTQHLQAGNSASILGGLTLRVVEVGRHGDDGLGDVDAEELAGVAHQLAQHLRADLLRGKLLVECGARNLHVPVSAPLRFKRDLQVLLCCLLVFATNEALH
mmetsp:Transcript_31302/g.52859  ORF Transcript_31302/g.52859 Transcript_31302/m.52859 type:complete len:154 (+) Transcript_31302:2277-2738(+)